MSSLVRTLQKRIFARTNVHEVPILDAQVRNMTREGEKEVQSRLPFFKNQIAFVGERRIFPGDKHPRFQPLIDLLTEDYNRV